MYSTFNDVLANVLQLLMQLFLAYNLLAGYLLPSFLEDWPHSLPKGGVHIAIYSNCIDINKIREFA